MKQKEVYWKNLNQFNIPEEDIITYTQGRCDFFAVALQRKFGGTLFVIEIDKKENCKENEWFFIHVYLKIDDKLYDIRGERNIENIDEELKFGYSEHEYNVVSFDTEEEMSLYIWNYKNKYKKDRILEKILNKAETIIDKHFDVNNLSIIV